MKIEDIKVGQTLNYVQGSLLYTVRYIGPTLIVLNNEASNVEASFHHSWAQHFEPYTLPIQVTAYVYFYLQGADQRPVHRLCYDETQLANLRAQDGVNHKLSPVTVVKTEFK